MLIADNLLLDAPSGVTVAFQCDITNGGNGSTELVVHVVDGALLVTTGVIAGVQPIRKIGAGLWNISGGVGEYLQR